MSGMRQVRKRVFLVLATVGTALVIAASAGAFDNNNPFTVPDGPCTVPSSFIPCAPTPPGTASLYPSPITVSGTAGNPPDITVRLKSAVQPPFNPFDDLDIVLVGPNGGQVILSSDAGLGCSICDPPGGGTIVFNDAGFPIPQDGDVDSGTHHPTNYVQQDPPPFAPQGGCTGEPADNWPTPGPGTTPTSTSLISTFGSSTGNGTWSLYIVDDCRHRNGTSPWTFGGWSITFAPPTGVKVASLAASAARGRVTVSWRTVQETNMLGFNVYRVGGSKRVKLNSKLIKAKASGRAVGSAYKVVDRKARAGVSYTYRLQVVELDGTRLWAGSTSTRAR